MATLLSPHFSVSELCCHHCGKYLVSQRLLDALEALRAKGPEPIFVDDACRCHEHNQAVGGEPDSDHLFDVEKSLECRAADIRIGQLGLQEMYNRALTVPDFFTGGIGVYDSNFIHVDVRGYKARWARKNGVYLPITVLVVE